MEVIAPFIEASDMVAQESSGAFKKCYQCGLCTGTCPWNQVRDFFVRKLIHRSQIGTVDFENEDVWLCATCHACVSVCPRGVAIIDIMRGLRRLVVGVGAGHLPDSLRVTMKNIAGVGNPQGEAPEKRVDWTKGLDIKTFSKGTEVLYSSCCISAYDPSVKRVAQATSNVMKKAGIDFGIIGAPERCCGESVRKAGNESLFQSLAQNNIGIFQEHGVKKIVVNSPHCYHTYKKEYPEFGGNFEVLHSTQLLAGLIREGRIKFSKELNVRVTYHDPCYLGRHNGIYDDPREVLRSIPGVELVEMPAFRESSLCCGGGGARIWMETKKEERFSDIRIKQAVEVKANILAAACPYCILNFEDGLLTSDKADILQVKDISELVLAAI